MNTNYTKIKKKFTSVINEQVILQKKINIADLSAAATNGTMHHAP